jgi:hypothetical protein
MTHCQFSVHFGDAQLVSITGQTPELTITVVSRTAAQRAKMQAMAEKWTQALTVEDFAQYMADFQRLVKGPWRSLVKADPPSAIAYRFTLTPLKDSAPRRKIGFRRKRDDVRPFDKTKPPADVSKNLQSPDAV